MDSPDKVQQGSTDKQSYSADELAPAGQSGQTRAGQTVSPVSNPRITQLAGESIGLGKQPQQPISDTAKMVSSQAQNDSYNSNSQEVDKLAKVALNSGQLTEVTDAETGSISIKNVDVKNISDSKFDELFNKLTGSKSNPETDINFEGIRKVDKEEFSFMQKARGVIKLDKQSGEIVAEDINKNNVTEKSNKVVGFCDLEDNSYYFEDSDDGRAAARALQEGNLIGNFEDPEDNLILINNDQSVKIRFVEPEKWDNLVQIAGLIHTAKLVENQKNNINNKTDKSDLTLNNNEIKSIKKLYTKSVISKQLDNLIAYNYKINISKKIIFELQELFNKERNVDEKEERRAEKKRSVLINYIKKEIIEKERRMMKRDKMNWFTLNMRSFLLYLIKKDVRILFVRGKD